MDYRSETIPLSLAQHSLCGVRIQGGPGPQSVGTLDFKSVGKHGVAGSHHNRGSDPARGLTHLGSLARSCLEIRQWNETVGVTGGPYWRRTSWVRPRSGTDPRSVDFVGIGQGLTPSGRALKGGIGAAETNKPDCVGDDMTVAPARPEVDD